ncbi:hypothetical protein EUGRSUZ_K01050 [Eucalyptus grandis]|uniref:Uncharacterized protein n=2 Tax=Eucalyptus grandis TaxID=71139 RepID=A0ACC3ITK5_EUCGR|nr:hypothetical protein EUGRSUZ_K01050 [Eucalyptus grandis]
MGDPRAPTVKPLKRHRLPRCVPGLDPENGVFGCSDRVTPETPKLRRLPRGVPGLVAVVAPAILSLSLSTPSAICSRVRVDDYRLRATDSCFSWERLLTLFFGLLVDSPAMASLFKDQNKLSAYRDRKFSGTQEEFEQALLSSTTVYIGNMSFYTTEEQVYELFSRAGELKKIIMGLDKNSKTPCGFCFVLYYSREDTEDAVKYISGTILDDRPIRVDFDWGFQEGRQWGRGRSGGQVRDEYRTDYDPDILLKLYF